MPANKTSGFVEKKGNFRFSKKNFVWKKISQPVRKKCKFSGRQKQLPGGWEPRRKRSLIIIREGFFLVRVPPPVHFGSPKNCTFFLLNGGSNSRFSWIYHFFEYVHSPVLARQNGRAWDVGKHFWCVLEHIYAFLTKKHVYTRVFKISRVFRAFFLLPARLFIFRNFCDANQRKSFPYGLYEDLALKSSYDLQWKSPELVFHRYHLLSPLVCLFSRTTYFGQPIL